jgi:hypothetical protein
MKYIQREFDFDRSSFLPNYVSDNINDLETVLFKHCINMEILKPNALVKKKDAVLNAIIMSVMRAKMTLTQVFECIKDIEKDKVVDTSLFNKGGNIDHFIKSKWLNFAKELWEQRSVGLGTPNAASGEGELMFIFLSPKIKKPKKGDLVIDGQKIELKASGARIIGNVSGKEFRKRTVDVCNKFKLIPNPNKVCKYAVELEKRSLVNYWCNELKKLSIKQQKFFITEWLMCLDNNYKLEFKLNCFNPHFNYDNFLKQIILKLYSDMINSGQFDKLVILGDGTNVKIIKGDVKDLSKKIDNGYLSLKADYFRVNQDANIGWYID